MLQGYDALGQLEFVTEMKTGVYVLDSTEHVVEFDLTPKRENISEEDEL